MVVLSYSWQKYKKGLEWKFTRGKAGASQGGHREAKGMAVDIRATPYEGAGRAKPRLSVMVRLNTKKHPCSPCSQLYGTGFHRRCLISAIRCKSFPRQGR